jgi:uncharacterized protein YbaR (Trm112 family)
VKQSLLDILACPICKNHPLKLFVFQEEEEIIEGLITCEECNRWYPIIDEIPFMLPDELRDGKDDIPFLTKWKDKFPKNILKNGIPFNETSI